jgi:hypothetical protein
MSDRMPKSIRLQIRASVRAVEGGSHQAAGAHNYPCIFFLGSFLASPQASRCKAPLKSCLLFSTKGRIAERFACA